VDPQTTDPDAIGAAVTDRAVIVTLVGRVMWLCTASSSLVTKRTSERERWTYEE
jgi:hypothetical protein